MFQKTGNIDESHKIRNDANVSREFKISQTARKIGILKLSIHDILKRCYCKTYFPIFVHAVNNDDPDRRVQFCK